MNAAERILIFCPTARIEPETVRAIFEQDYRGATDVWFTRDNPHGHEIIEADYANMLYNVQRMRDVALRGNYDAVWLVESDMLPPTDALSKLLQGDGDTVSGVYAMRRGQYLSNVIQRVGDGVLQAVAWSELTARWGQTIETDGTCFGCILMRRAALEKIEFRLDGAHAPDWTWMLDASAAGVTQLCDLSVECGHKCPDGLILWANRGGVQYERTAPSWWQTI